MPKKQALKFSYLSIRRKFEDLFSWLEEISRFNKVKDFVYIADYKEGRICLRIFTKDNCYGISAILPGVRDKEVLKDVNGEYREDNGYLGCVATTRKPRAGEDWNRGRDLADGSYSKETWQEIKDDIIAYELVKVVRNSPSNKEYLMNYEKWKDK